MQLQKNAIQIIYKFLYVKQLTLLYYFYLLFFFFNKINNTCFDIKFHFKQICFDRLKVSFYLTFN